LPANYCPRLTAATGLSARHREDGRKHRFKPDHFSKYLSGFLAMVKCIGSLHEVEDQPFTGLQGGARLFGEFARTE
jgi:hypothetical protein